MRSTQLNTRSKTLLSITSSQFPALLASQASAAPLLPSPPTTHAAPRQDSPSAWALCPRCGSRRSARARTHAARGASLNSTFALRHALPPCRTVGSSAQPALVRFRVRGFERQQVEWSLRMAFLGVGFDFNLEEGYHRRRSRGPRARFRQRTQAAVSLMEGHFEQLARASVRKKDDRGEQFVISLDGRKRDR